MVVSILGVRGIKDTQCGFKFFTRKAAELIFFNLHLERWAFDVEMIYIGQLFKVPMEEVAVNWTEVPGFQQNKKHLSPFCLHFGSEFFVRFKAFSS